RALSVAFLENQTALQFGDLAADVVGLGQIKGARPLAGALRFGGGGDLRQVGGIGHPLVALVLKKEPGRRLGAGTGKADKRHGAVGILDGDLQRRPQLVGVKRPVTGLILPARILLDKLAIADLLPVANAGGIAGERRVVGAEAVVGRAVGREA